MSMIDDLYAIERYDPDGGETEPTEAAYQAFETWVRDRYGEATWDRYRAGGWGEDRSEGDWSHHYDAYDY